MSVASNFILDNQGITLRQVDGMVDFDLLDASFNILGRPEVISASSVSVSTSSTTVRTISGVQITSNSMADIDPFNYLIRPKIVLGDGTEWPMGVFVFTEQIDVLRFGVYPVSLTLSDMSANLNLPSIYGFSRATGYAIETAILDILDAQRISIRAVPTERNALGSAQTWAPGTTWLKILADLCALGGYYPPYFDNNGRFTVRAPVDSLHADADIVYQSNQGKIMAGTIQVTHGVLTAPNAYAVVDTAPKSSPISAISYVNPGLPWSKQNRGGLLYPQVITQQGLSSIAQAQQMADTAANSAPKGFQTIQFSSLPDPRHDVFQIVEWDGTLYQETAWSMPLKWGEAMTHTITQGGFGQNA